MKDKNNEILAVVGLIIIVLVVWLIEHRKVSEPTAEQTGPTLIAQAHYTCDKGKFIDAAFYDSDATTTPAQPGQPPVPTGSVDVALDGAGTTTLNQTISADGARYANADESFVFWSKGNQALIMHNNSMDLTYTNCATPAS